MSYKVKIIYLLNNQEIRLKLKQNARTKAEKNFSEKNFVKKIEEIILNEEYSQVK